MKHSPVIPNERRTLAERFTAKIEVVESGCWEWRGAHDRKGYGQIRIGSRNRMATHVALELNGQQRPSQAHCALHRCDNPPCVNPAHLWWGTVKENQQDALKKGRLNLSGLELGRKEAAPKPVVQCECCGKTFVTRKAQFENNKRHFCSTACTWAWQSANYTGAARSSWAA